MARDPRVRVRLEADDRTGPAVQRAQGRLARFGNFISSRLAITLGDLQRIISGVVNAFGSFLKASQEQEDAVRRLDVALLKLGPDADATSEALQRQAAALEATTRFSDEAVISAQAFLAQLGVTAEQLPEATAATVNLAAALNIDLTAAARLTGRTVGGFAGELGEVIPELKELSTEALQAGAGITFLQNRFKGTAQQDVKTFSGQIEQLRNGFGTLAERVGDALTQNVAFRGGIQRLTKIITSERVIQLVEDFADAVAQLVSATAAVVGKLVEWYTAFDELNKRLGVVNPALKEQTEEVEKQNVELPKLARNWEDLNETSESTTTIVDETRRSITEERIEIEVLGREVAETSRVVRQEFVEAQRDTQAEVRITAQEFDRLAESIGRVAAVQQSLSQGGRLSQGGSRVQLPGGGSRLTSEPGTTGFGFSSGRFVFVDGRRARVFPDGRVEFV